MLQKVPTAQTLSNGTDKLRWSRQEPKLWPPQLSFMTSRFTTHTQRVDKQTFLGLLVIMTWIFKQMELANVFQFCNWTLVINQSGDEFSVAQIGHSFMWKYYSSSCCSRHCKKSRCAQQDSGRVFLHSNNSVLFIMLLWFESWAEVGGFLQSWATCKLKRCCLCVSVCVCVCVRLLGEPAAAQTRKQNHRAHRIHAHTDLHTTLTLMQFNSQTHTSTNHVDTGHRDAEEATD